ncbi:hypothetical protein JHL17_13350 [Azospirillum sp. YIM B02556]|uniref:Uncharacterized protein n=1 Tax=Azospirillum endophyticum TaxID=2800326 RepID=A0ABS1F4P9_9PROT|nr:hypothetical protein [Azospirillum endophyticum]MBK1838400.1 hypothetical protein [Azospirillum endophyticum]
MATTNGTFELAARRLAAEHGVMLVVRASLPEIGGLVAGSGIAARS